MRFSWAMKKVDNDQRARKYLLHLSSSSVYDKEINASSLFMRLFLY